MDLSPTATWGMMTTMQHIKVINSCMLNEIDESLPSPVASKRTFNFHIDFLKFSHTVRVLHTSRRSIIY